MRLVPMLMILIMLQLGLWIFYHNADPTQAEGGFMQPNMTNIYQQSNVSVPNSGTAWNFFFDPVQWNSNAFIYYLLGGVIALGTIGAAGAFFFRSDIAILFGLFVVILGLGTIPIIGLWNAINSEIAYGTLSGVCPISTDPLIPTPPCTIGIILSAIICVPLTVYWIFVCIEWWSGRPTS